VIESPKSVSRQAYEQIRAAIVTGQFQLGERLFEAQIAKEMGISRAPVREAISRLEQEGLVVNKPRYGPHVRDLTAKDISELYRVRAALEALAIEQLIENDPATALRDLERIVADMADAAESMDLARVAECEVLFHKRICEHSGNALLSHIYETISAQFRIAVALDDARFEDLAARAHAHEPLLAAIRERNVAQAIARIREHIKEFLPDAHALARYRETR